MNISAEAHSSFIQTDGTWVSYSDTVQIQYLIFNHRAIVGDDLFQGDQIMSQELKATFDSRKIAI